MDPYTVVSLTNCYLTWLEESSPNWWKLCSMLMLPMTAKSSSSIKVTPTPPISHQIHIIESESDPNHIITSASITSHSQSSIIVSDVKHISRSPRWTSVCWVLWWLCSSCFGPSWEIALLPRTGWGCHSRPPHGIPWVMNDHRFFHSQGVSWRTLGKNRDNYVNGCRFRLQQQWKPGVNFSGWTMLDWSLSLPVHPPHIIQQWEWLQHLNKTKCACWPCVLCF